MNPRSFAVIGYDLVAVLVAWFGGLLLRFNLSWTAAYEPLAVWGALWLLPWHFVVCGKAGLYRGMWVFASLPDLQRVIKAVAGSSLAMVAFGVIFQPAPTVPRSMLVIYPLLLLVAMAGGRLAVRMWKEHQLFGSSRAMGKPVIVLGAGAAAAALIKDLERTPDWRVVGLLDDDHGKWGRDLAGHPVLGATSALPEVARAYKARHAILAMPSVPANVRSQVANLGVTAGLHMLTVPALDDIMSGRLPGAHVRKLEINDLLGREAVEIDTRHISRTLGGKVVMVTGAGGSIGSELCRQLASFSPTRLILFEQTEFALYSIEQWFRCECPDLEIVPLAGDVKDGVRLRQVFAAWRPDVVFHAAAYKHVPLMEVGNAWQAVRNNVQGTLNLVRCAREFAASRFVLISTDKAVNPTNVMGATKRLAEMVCQLEHVLGGSLTIEVVRFGNVLGSAGSVIPKFIEQIGRGGPVTVTHPEITRYFMSIPEAALLVLQAASMGKGGEIHVLDMGDPVKIVDLARNMIRLSGFSDEEIRIEFTGLRPGEKLYEELLADSEQTQPTPHAKVRVASCRPVDAGLVAELESWLACEGYPSDDDVRERLQRWVPEYSPANVDAVGDDQMPLPTSRGMR